MIWIKGVLLLAVMNVGAIKVPATSGLFSATKVAMNERAQMLVIEGSVGEG